VPAVVRQAEQSKSKESSVCSIHDEGLLELPIKSLAYKCLAALKLTAISY
jgi:hypothetical protein